MSKIVNTYKGTLDDGEIPPIVYKYRFWDNIFHKKFITEREVFMAPPSSFEDIIDCKLPIRYDLLNEKQTMAWAMRMSKLENPNYYRQQHRRSSIEWMKEKRFKNKRFLEEYQKYYFEEHDKRRGILSLTEEPCLLGMWQKYADNHQGFCIGYNSRIMFEYLGGGGKVEYYEELPIIYPEPVMDSLEIHMLQIYSKEKKWEFEKEYRTQMFRPNPIDIPDRQIKLPKEAFNKIILGKDISEKNKEEIINATHSSIGNIPIINMTDFCV